MGYERYTSQEAREVLEAIYQRVLASPLAREEDKAKLQDLYQTLNPVELKRRVHKNLERLSRLHG